ncbi:MAG TPA: Rad52/Rad22 family DNA repair protein [Gemmataceae bacterium]|nr:Rad52/Rad22 family DNA repair protein [Gemmataceae bacterium]
MDQSNGKKSDIVVGAPGVDAVMQALADPFAPEEVRFKPQVISGNRAMAIAYVDARIIQDRLDEVLGVAGWQDEYEVLPDGNVVCRLRLRLGDEWITKMDVGGPSEQPDEGDRRKAAFSDALKRAAVKFGVGRYLYRLPNQWVDFDPQKRQFVRPPKLPPWALPRRPAAALPAPVATKPPETRSRTPADGAELRRRLEKYEQQLVQQKRCQPGELIGFVTAAGLAAGYDADLATWRGPAIQLAVEQAKVFKDRMRQPAETQKGAA